MSSCLITLPAFAYFQRWGSGARPRGMGEAVTARVGSVDFLTYNPAGLARLTGLHLSSHVARLMGGFTDGSELFESGLAGAWAEPGWAVAGGWQSRGLSAVFLEQQVTGSIAVNFQTPWLQELGVTVKYLQLVQSQTAYVPLNASLVNLSPSAWSMDIGLSWLLEDRVRAGLSLLDLLEPSLSMVGEVAAVPKAIRIGLAWEWLDPAAVWSWDYVVRGSGVDVRMGVESALAREVQLRVGVVGTGPTGWSSFQLASATFGGGLEWPMSEGIWTVQYSGDLPLASVAGVSWSHRVSLGLRIGAKETGTLPVAVDRPVVVPEVKLLPLPWWLASDSQTGEGELEEVMRAIEGDRSNAPLVHRAALLTGLYRTPREAIVLYQHLLTLDPKYERVGLQAIHQLRYAEEALTGLVEAYRQAARGESRLPGEALLGLGYLLVKSRQFQEADGVYQQWREQTENPALGGLFSWAGALLELSNAKKAQAVLAEARGQRLKGEWMSEMRGRVLLADPKTAEEAILAFREAEQLGSHAWRAKYHLAVALYQTLRLEEALALVQDIETLPGGTPDQAALLNAFREAVVKVYAARGEAAFEVNNLPEALEAFQQALAVIPDDVKSVEGRTKTLRRIGEEVQIHRNLALQALERSRYDQAIREWRWVKRVEPANEEAIREFDKLYKHLVSQAEDNLAKKQMDRLHSYLKTLEEVAPDDPKVKEMRHSFRRYYDTRSKELEGQGKFQEAVVVWDEILKLLVQDEEASQRRAALLAGLSHRADEALAEAKQFQGQGKWVYARDRINEALSIRPEWEDAKKVKKALEEELAGLVRRHLTSAREAVKSAKYSEARKWYQAVLEVDPVHAEAKAELDKLKSTELSREAELWRSGQKFEAERKPLPALEVLTELLRVRPGHDEAKKLMELIKQRLATAKEHAEKVKALVLKGDLAYGDGNLKAALESYEQASELDYYNTSIRRQIDDVKKELK